MLSGDYSKQQNEHEAYVRSSTPATGNITLKNIRDIAVRGVDIARGMAGFLDVAISAQPQSIVEQDRNKILGDIEILSQKHYLTMGIEQKKALQAAKELLAFALTQKR